MRPMEPLDAFLKLTHEKRPILAPFLEPKWTNNDAGRGLRIRLKKVLILEPILGAFWGPFGSWVGKISLRL